jgi:MscS family membrane protein
MHDLTWTHVVVIIAALAGAALLGRLVGQLVSVLAGKLAQVNLGDEARRARVATRLRGPISLVLTLGIWQLALVFFDVPDGARATLHEIGRVGLVLALVWLALAVVDLAADSLSSRSEFFALHAGSRALLPLGRRIAKILIAAVAIVAVLGSLGYSVTGLVAGLGITGIAVALAAQKTLENVLGAFALGIDQPLREGDFVKVDQTIGTVERIGLRSTRVRTPDRTLVAYPNGKLADSVIERYSARDRTRFDVHFRIALGTTSEQLRAVRDQLRTLLSNHPARALDKPSVHVTGPGDTWFDLEAIAWFQTSDWEQFQEIRDQLIFDCLSIFAKAKVVLQGAPPPAPDAPRAEISEGIAGGAAKGGGEGAGEKPKDPRALH